jgi:hypothetical protein
MSPFFGLLESVDVEELEKGIVTWKDLSSSGIFP